MAYRLERLSALASRRRVTVLVVLAIGAAAVSLLWGPGDSHPVAPQSGADRAYIVQSRPFTSSVSVVGTIVPGESAEVLAPFDGTVSKVSFEYGREVQPGQVLVVMDPFELEQRRRDAESAFLKATQADAELASWSTGPEVARARRAVTTADLGLRDIQRKTIVTKGLLERGLVARDEYDASVVQQQGAVMALAAAHEDLTTILKRGDDSGRRVAAIDLQNARDRLDDLTAQLSGATVRAPASGILVRPPADKGDIAGGPLHAGQRLTRGQLIGSIAKPAGLAIAMKLDEADANRVREGQPVVVTGPGFAGLTVGGQVSSVAGEGTAADPGAQSSSFTATARLTGLSPEEARTIRIGMSANVTITLYQATSAIVVPPQAVQGGEPTAVVTVRNPKTGGEQPRSVEIGAIAPDGVEIRSGLNPGDVVTWREFAPSPGS